MTTQPTVGACSVCGSYALHFHEEYWRCGRCGVVRTKYDYDARLYGEEYANIYVRYSRADVNIPLNLFRLGLVSRWMGVKDKLLDIGCCVGEFVRFAERYYSCMGYEPNSHARQEACCRTTSPIFDKLDRSIPKVQCVTMFDVIEHIENPKALLGYLSEEYLLKGGVIVITTPNSHAAPDHHSLEKWKHYKPKEHLWIYTEESLASLFTKIGFECLYWGYEESGIRPNNPNNDILTFVVRKL